MRSIYTPTRESFIPKGAIKVADKLSDAVAYIYDTPNGQPATRVFYGKQAKPVTAYRYRTHAERETAVLKAFESRRASLKLKAETKGKRTAENGLTVGDILNTCWGYDQTNREFFEVTEVRGKHVIVREIAQASESTGHDTGRCAPQSGEFIGKPMRKLVQWGTSVTIDDVRTARKWNTSTVAGVPVWPALSWSSYA